MRSLVILSVLLIAFSCLNNAQQVIIGQHYNESEICQGTIQSIEKFVDGACVINPAFPYTMNINGNDLVMCTYMGEKSCEVETPTCNIVAQFDTCYEAGTSPNAEYSFVYNIQY